MRCAIMTLSGVIITALLVLLTVSCIDTPQENFDKGETAREADNYQEAVIWWSQAARQGHEQAQNKLNGIAEQSRKTAARGDADAQSILGFMYSEGLGGIAQDNKTAAKWFRQAAEQGNAWGQFGLGDMYEDGAGVIKNYKTAYIFYLLALANMEYNSEREKVARSVARVEKLLTAEQRQCAQEAAAKYQRKIDTQQ